MKYESDWEFLAKSRLTLEIFKRHPTIQRKLIESLTAAWNRGVTHDHLVKLSTQFRHDTGNRWWAKALDWRRLVQKYWGRKVWTRQINVKVALWRHYVYMMEKAHIYSQLIVIQLWWTNRHFYEVSIGGSRYIVPKLGCWFSRLNTTSVTLNRIISSKPE